MVFVFLRRIHHSPTEVLMPTGIGATAKLMVTNCDLLIDLNGDLEVQMIIITAQGLRLWSEISFMRNGCAYNDAWKQLDIFE